MLHQSLASPSDRRIEIRRALVNDLHEVNQLLVNEYGTSYPYPLDERNIASGDILLVAECDQQIVGFAKAAANGMHQVFEFGRLVVHPEFRKQGLAKNLTAHRLHAVASRGARLGYSEPVCHRADCASQRNIRHHGFQMFGILPVRYPGIKGELLGDQPESVCMTVRSLHPHGALSHGALQLPSWLMAPVAQLTRRLTRRKEQVVGHMPKPDWHDEFRIGPHVGSSYVDIPANWSETSVQIDRAYDRGYRFCGFIPEYGQTTNGDLYDAVRLYRPHASHRVDFSLIYVVDDLLPLKHFMQQEAMS